MDNLAAVSSPKDLVTKEYLVAFLLSIYPIGTIYMSMVYDLPSALFGGTWIRIEDKFLLGAVPVDFPAGGTGGAATHTLAVTEIPAHKHPMAVHAAAFVAGVIAPQGASGAADWALATSPLSNTGGGLPHNNMPPYIRVYMWQRAA